MLFGENVDPDPDSGTDDLISAVHNTHLMITSKTRMIFVVLGRVCSL